MSTALGLEDALARVPGWASADIRSEPLPGGRTNRNFLVRADGTPYVLRLGVAHPEQLGIRRSDEFAAILAAAEAGIAPKVHWADTGHGILVSEYIVGRHWSPTDIRDSGNLERLIATLRRAHGLKLDAQPFDPVTV